MPLALGVPVARRRCGREFRPCRRTRTTKIANLDHKNGEPGHAIRVGDTLLACPGRRTGFANRLANSGELVRESGRIGFVIFLLRVRDFSAPGSLAGPRPSATPPTCNAGSQGAPTSSRRDTATGARRSSSPSSSGSICTVGARPIWRSLYSRFRSNLRSHIFGTAAPGFWNGGNQFLERCQTFLARL